MSNIYDVNELYKGWYTCDVYENCPIFRTPPLPTLCPCRSKILRSPWNWTSNFKPNPLPFPNDNQSIKKSIIQRWLLGPTFRAAFVFSTNSLILSGFPLTSFHLAEASLSAFSWLHTLECGVIQKYHEMSFIYNYSHFSSHFAIDLFYLHNMKT